MSSLPVPAPHSAAQLAARAQARLLAHDVTIHRQAVAAMVNARPGMCMANGWDVSFDELNGDFDLDTPLLERLLTQGGPPGPSMRAMPGPGQARTAADATSAFKAYVFAPPSPAPVGSARRLSDETASAVYGPGNILANASASLAGALQGYGEHDAAKRLAQGLADILAGRVNKVPLAPPVDLYNSAQGKQPPRVRLRVRGLPIKVVTATVPTVGGPVTQWRSNGPGNAASLGARNMTAQQMRNALGFATGALVTGAVAILAGPAVAASALVIGSALLAGVAVQIVWNLAGGADAADAFASSALK